MTSALTSRWSRVALSAAPDPSPRKHAHTHSHLKTGRTGQSWKEICLAPCSEQGSRVGRLECAERRNPGSVWKAKVLAGSTSGVSGWDSGL